MAQDSPAVTNRPPPLGSNYRKLWTASALSNLADGVFQVALPLLALRLTQSPGAIAGLALAGRLPWLVFALQAGALADRLDRRVTMVRVDLARAVLLGGLAAIVAVERDELWLLYIVAFALGIGETLFDTSAQSVMPNLVATEDLSRANGRLYAVELTMNQFIGPPIGGLLAGTAIALAFAGSAACYLVAAGALFAMTGTFRAERSGPRTRIRTDIREGVRYLATHRLLRTFAVMVGVMNMCYTASYAVFPLFAVKPGPLGLSDVGFGILITFGAIGSLVGSMAAAPAERILGRHRVLMLSLILSCPSLALWATGNLVIVAVSGTLSGFGIVLWNVVTVSLRQRVVPDHLLGRVNSAYRLLAWGTMPIGAAMGGVIAEIVGLRALFVGCGVVSSSLFLLRRFFTDEAMDEAERTKEPAPTS